MKIEEIRSSIDYLDACLRDIADRADVNEQDAFESGLAERNRLADLEQRHAEIARLASLPGHTEAPSTGPQIIRKADPMDIIEDRRSEEQHV